MIYLVLDNPSADGLLKIKIFRFKQKGRLHVTIIILWSSSNLMWGAPVQWLTKLLTVNPPLGDRGSDILEAASDKKLLVLPDKEHCS